jgi:hypothetical protein
MNGNIIDFGAKSTNPVVETFDYRFTTKDGADYTRHGILTMNPMFYGVTDAEQRLIFCIAQDHILSVDRVEPAPVFNA